VAAARPSRLSYGALAAGAGGLILILSLFLDWQGITGFSLNAWDLFSIMDFFLLLVGLAAVAFAAMEAFALQVTLPFDRVRALTILGIIATSFVWGGLLESEHIKIGFILAAIGSLAILAGGILAERSPTLGVANPAAAGGPLAGVGPGAPGGGGIGSGQPGGYGGQQAAPPAQQPQVAQPAQPSGGQPADWYPDPRGEKRLRYWDGSQWTDHTAD
jgi:uncharacterized protein DUF2510